MEEVKNNLPEFVYKQNLCSLFAFFNSKFIARLLSDWLSGKDICRLDSALCCSKNRSRFLHSVCKHLKIYFGSPYNNISINVNCIHWLDLRNIDAREMEFNLDFSSAEKSCSPTETYLHYFRCRSATGNDGSQNSKVVFRRTESLNFIKCTGVVDDLVVKACRVCPILRKLNLSGCKSISNVSLICISVGCPQLTDLNIFNCSLVTDTGIMSIAEGCKNLISINIGWCQGITDQGLICLVCSVNSILELDIGGCSNLSDLSLEKIAECCPMLRRLNISYNSNFTDVGLSHFSRCRLHNLKFIHLGKCTLFTEEGFAMFAEACPSLQELDLYSCDKITDIALSKIIDCCTSLSHLNISHCYQITDVGLVNLAERGQSLNYVSVCGCDLLTEVGLLYFHERKQTCIVKRDY